MTESRQQRFHDKRFLVTGGGRGIGAAIARRLAGEGAAVAVNYVANPTTATDLVEELRRSGARAAALQADVSDAEQAHQLVRRAAEELGGLDGVACSAGVEHFGPLASLTRQDFDRVFHTNVAGQLFVTQAAADRMGDGGRIVLMSSVSARIGVYQHSLYAASKAAVSAMVLNLAPELAERGIAINAIAPGGTATDMAAEVGARYTPPGLRDVPPETVLASMNALGRLADADEIAAVAAFLLSADASYLTGATIDASGGWM
ncbi:SDR family oxidoreductase [Mycobacterium sp. 1274756.6]|uniref:SDR family NAD(P)-dependent oxidoreductase n=1 Tax=Mycobacterium sp. 1274756.6 TaxID=1834076 RepID=UPI0007FE094A|nr:SDR family oxidoreductase [Mycobacterium sp. 1274756.6]OBJ71661.1 dehydrogenase [Mycobacterium sp. 1274756.6]